MDERDVQEAWALLEKKQEATTPKLKEVQERLLSCSYAMSHPESGRLVPACAQHSVLDPLENKILSAALPCSLGSTSGAVAGSEGKKRLDW